MKADPGLTRQDKNKKRERGGVRQKQKLDSPAVLFAVAVLFTGAGTAVMFLFTSDADLFFSEATLSTGRKMCLGLERRVLTFPSGWLRELDLELFVSAGLGCGLRLPV